MRARNPLRRLQAPAALTVLCAAGALAAGAALPVLAAATTTGTKTTSTKTTGTTTTGAKKTSPTPTKKTSGTKKTTPAAPAGQDWEANGATGLAASFSAVTTTVKGKKSELLDDIAVQAPINCADSPTPATPIDTEVITANVRVAANGSFSTGSIKTGGSGTVFSGRIQGKKVTISYRHVARTPNEYDGNTEVCDTGKVRLSGAPGHRATLPDESWAGQTADGQPVVINVVAGGRALQEQPHPPANGAAQASIAFGTFTQSCGVSGCTELSADVCAYAETSTLFVASNGTFGNSAYQDDDLPIYTGQFTSAHKLNGTFTNNGQGCEEQAWSATPG
jgi:hypothetical protein